MNPPIQSKTVPKAEQVAVDHLRYLFPCTLPLYNDPIILAEGSGTRVFDSDGREYLDLFSGILTTSVGHSHPDVVSRVREQVGKLGHTSTLYLNEPQVRFGCNND